MSSDILRLTALFHARRGRAFLSSLSVREGRNYQFDFLRPTHSLYGYYNRMVESYQKIMQPPPGQIDTLIKAANDPLGRWGILEEGRNRAEWEKYRRRKEDIKQKEKDEEAEADAVIDWQDFVLVETIEFTQSDMELNLPPPSSIEELRNRSMGEKRMASMIMEETGAGPVPGAPTGPRSQRQPQQPVQQQQQQDEEMDVEEEDEEQEELRLQRIKEEKEQARAREIQRAAMESRGMKIKKDYVPKGMFSPFETDITKVSLTDRYQPDGHRQHGQVSQLWSVHSRERTRRAHPNRAPRSSMERTKAAARSAQEPTSLPQPRRRHYILSPQSRIRTYRSVWGRDGRSNAQGQRRGREAQTAREGKDCVGWSYRFGRQDERQFPDVAQSRRADQAYAPAYGFDGGYVGRAKDWSGGAYWSEGAAGGCSASTGRGCFHAGWWDSVRRRNHFGAAFRSHDQRVLRKLSSAPCAGIAESAFCRPGWAERASFQNSHDGRGRRDATCCAGCSVSGTARRTFAIAAIRPGPAYASCTSSTANHRPNETRTRQRRDGCTGKAGKGGKVGVWAVYRSRLALAAPAPHLHIGAVTRHARQARVEVGRQCYPLGRHHGPYVICRYA